MGVKLIEFEILYKPHSSIKGQALTNFIVECTIDRSEDESSEDIGREDSLGRDGTWVVYVDGSSADSGSGAGVVIESPDGQAMEYAIRFGFRATNNVAEYESVVTGLKLCMTAGATQVNLRIDSKLVAAQIRGEYEAREESMENTCR